MKKKKPTLKKLPKYSTGGNILKNVGLGLADTALSAVGASNVVTDDEYKGEGSQFMRGFGDVVGGAAKAALPMAANLVAPGVGGMVAKGAQSVGGALNPEDTSIDPKTGLPYGQQTKALGQAAGQLAPLAGMMFPMGGVNSLPNAGSVIHAPELGGYFRKRQK